MALVQLHGAAPAESSNPLSANSESNSRLYRYGAGCVASADNNAQRIWMQRYKSYTGKKFTEIDLTRQTQNHPAALVHWCLASTKEVPYKQEITEHDPQFRLRCVRAARDFQQSLRKPLLP
jgi:hypothetical protein